MAMEPELVVVALPIFVLPLNVTVVASAGSAIAALASVATSGGGVGVAEGAWDAAGVLLAVGASLCSAACEGAAVAGAVGAESPHDATTNDAAMTSAPARSNRMILPPGLPETCAIVPRAGAPTPERAHAAERAPSRDSPIRSRRSQLTVRRRRARIDSWTTTWTPGRQPASDAGTATPPQRSATS